MIDAVVNTRQKVKGETQPPLPLMVFYADVRMMKHTQDTPHHYILSSGARCMKSKTHKIVSK